VVAAHATKAIGQSGRLSAFSKITAEKVSGMYRPGADISVPLLGLDRRVEVKVRANGFRELYAWLDGRDLLIVRADRRKPLVILPLRFAAEIAGIAEKEKQNGI
jgi:hypothetical protein